MNGGNRDGRFGLTPLPEYVAKANAETFVGLQIETKGAIDAVAELAALPDVDLLFVGPADISQVLGVPGDFENPRCLEIIERIASACRDAGKPWGSCLAGRSTRNGWPAGVARCSSWRSTSTWSMRACARRRSGIRRSLKHKAGFQREMAAGNGMLPAAIPRPDQRVISDRRDWRGRGCGSARRPRRCRC